VIDERGHAVERNDQGSASYAGRLASANDNNSDV
jgi:hypothetical protein